MEIISSDLYFPLENQVHSQFNFLCSCYSSSDIEIHCWRPICVFIRSHSFFFII